MGCNDGEASQQKYPKLAMLRAMRKLDADKWQWYRTFFDPRFSNGVLSTASENVVSEVCVMPKPVEFCSKNAKQPSVKR